MDYTVIKATSDADLAAHLADCSVPTLLAVAVHLAADDAERDQILATPHRPEGAMLNEYQGYMSPEDLAAARELVLGVVARWRDRGCPEPAPLSQAHLKATMDLVVAESVGEEYVPLMIEELGLGGADARAEAVVPGAEDLPVVVIGCGMSGILAAVRLADAGHPYVVVEKNAGPGGTWFENTYPGARVDVGSHFYSYSFEPSDHWTEFFARQPELLAYFGEVMKRHGITEHVRFGVEVLGATWDDQSGTWAVALDDGTTLTARAVISAVGLLSRPFIPELPGSFDGPAFHTARWDHDVDLTGKRVVMVGAGATGFQIAPAIADQVAHLTVIQRTAQWMFPNPGYHDPVGAGARWALTNLPFYARWFRFLIFYPGCDTGMAAAKVDRSWSDPGGGQQYAVSEINEMVRVMFTEWITDQVDNDPDLVAKVVPNYPPTGKRTLQDNGSWLRTLTRPDVDLVRAGVARLEPNGIVDSDGAFHEADVIIWATGFRANEMLAPLQILGREGVDLREHWGTRPRAHMGVTVPGFPNFFMIYGPGTNLASGGSIILASECAMRFVSGALRLLATSGAQAIEVRTEVYDEWYRRCQEELRETVWASPAIEHSYYLNADGEVHVLNPWRLVDYWGWTQAPDPADYVLSR